MPPRARAVKKKNGAAALALALVVEPPAPAPVPVPAVPVPAASNNADVYLDPPPAVRAAVDAFLSSAAAAPGAPALLLLHGAPGTGKTTLLQRAFKAHGVKPLTLNVESFQALKQFKDLVENFCFSRTITELLGPAAGAPKVLFLDDFDILVHQDKLLLGYVAGVLERLTAPGGGAQAQAQRCRVAIACGRHDAKKMAVLHGRHGIVVELPPPSEDALVGLWMARRPPEAGAQLLPEAEVRDYVRRHFCNPRRCALNWPLFVETRRAAAAAAADADANANDATNDADPAPLLRPDASWTETVEALLEAPAPVPAQELEIQISSDPSLLAYLLYDNWLGWAASRCTTAHARALAQAPDLVDAAVRDVLEAFAEGSVLERQQFDNLATQASFLVRVGRLQAALHAVLPATAAAAAAARRPQAQTQKPYPYVYTTVLNRTGLQAISIRRAAKIVHRHHLNREQLRGLYDAALSGSRACEAFVRETLQAGSGLQYHAQTLAAATGGGRGGRGGGGDAQ